ncbi:MAG TPA: hypothetical protein VGS96_05215 [Thermoanaerobaculia bacterium]|nr:hypothetical protein [Thermoanaerobaculia bacterium]
MAQTGLGASFRQTAVPVVFISLIVKRSSEKSEGNRVGLFAKSLQEANGGLDIRVGKVVDEQLQPFTRFHRFLFRHDCLKSGAGLLYFYTPRRIGGLLCILESRRRGPDQAVDLPFGGRLALENAGRRELLELLIRRHRRFR